MLDYLNKRLANRDDRLCLRAATSLSAQTPEPLVAIAQQQPSISTTPPSTDIVFRDRGSGATTSRTVKWASFAFET